MTICDKFDVQRDKKKSNNCISCNHCSMQVICLPLKSGNTEISIMDNYLSKQSSIDISENLFIKQAKFNAKERIYLCGC